jgi:hypothetical protein
MELNIKYKEIDKGAKVLEILDAYSNYTRSAQKAPGIIKAYSNAIGNVYKEDSKLIDSVEISRTFVKDTPIKLIRLDVDKRALITDQAYQCIAMNKEELKQYINMLTAIEKQIEG